MPQPEVQTHALRSSDGRALSVETGGDPDGTAVLVHNGTPNSRHLYGPWVDDAAQRGIRLISYDRPGYGGSAPHPGRSVADCASDVRAIADALGAKRIAAWGLSGGGPHALACAALLPDLVVAVSVLGSVAPYGAEGLDYFAGMGADNVEDIELYLDDPAAARTKSSEDREKMLAAGPEQLTALMRSLLSPDDAAVLVDEYANYMVRGLHDGLAPGDEGWWEDGVAHMSPWGFDVMSIQMPVQVWHGRHDRFVPIQHGQWLADHVPGAEAHLSETDGHLTLLVERVPEVHAWLLDHF